MSVPVLVYPGSPENPDLVCLNLIAKEFLLSFLRAGTYIYLEASNLEKGSKALVRTSLLPVSGQVTISFWFHMRGNSMGSISLFIEARGEWRKVFGQVWFFREVSTGTRVVRHLKMLVGDLEFQLLSPRCTLFSVNQPKAYLLAKA